LVSKIKLLPEIFGRTPATRPKNIYNEIVVNSKISGLGVSNVGGQVYNKGIRKEMRNKNDR